MDIMRFALVEPVVSISIPALISNFLSKAGSFLCLAVMGGVLSMFDSKSGLGDTIALQRIWPKQYMSSSSCTIATKIVCPRFT